MNVYMFKITQNYSKITITFLILTIYGILYLSSSVSSVDAAPRDPRWGTPNVTCDDEYDYETDTYVKTCCWREPIPGQILGQEYCQTCTSDGKNCGDKEKKMDPIKTPQSARPPTNNDQVLENPETEQQPNPNSPITDQRVPPGNVGVLEQLEDSSNSESGDSVSSENPGLFNVVPQSPTVSEQQTTDDNNNENVPQDNGAQR